MKKIFFTLVILVVVFGLLAPSLSFAADNCTDAQKKDPNSPCNPDFTGGSESSLWQMMFGGGLNAIGEQVYGESAENTDLQALVLMLVPAFLSLLATIFLIIMLYAGFRWMYAGGKQEQIDDAKKWIRNSIIGLAIVLAAYAITSFVINALTS
jgi:cbb3-type cytochrome oxidase subunit 3